MGVNKALIKQAVKQILVAIGEDPEREGLRRTPDRVANMLEELTNGREENVQYTLFEGSSNMVIVAGIRFSTLCEHHLLPMLGVTHVAYIPSDKVIGVSKIPRIVVKYSRMLQLQERLTRQIMNEVSSATGSGDVMVLTEAYHTCMMIRGVRSASPLVSMAYKGKFNDSSLRLEFLEYIRPFRLNKFLT
ncbi:GTP cyclohydrolase I FolE [Caldivirga maquilingensis]|uniref:GTP cyclohydrolase 1 n=1 Tax=Caldivirga maquilingensis (strain ATCC 700844 / DSM 13496 / JCM 10307 / IC-167) TaxID=397948 RepID=GCH1_CALMQ|nr:GTP cyclohydrolase I FolE [Caldivirga maquilingensis]A8MC60.1 RecName: Full=GTP cyclohydrolase 1; AltName: Full=GTP cyclohydrolase I; Short=GTP-CH-I [Caldivirga maquilingensis IC-167]ABW01366.1 GTP cyclohydrolase I [Caldivirga maquilingensis IC-167]